MFATGTILNMITWGKQSTFTKTGVPLCFGTFTLLWIGNFFPNSIYDSEYTIDIHNNFITILLHVITTDALQYMTHVIGHKVWKSSHFVHHKHTQPSSDISFDTGICDAILQLILPLFTSIHIIYPNKSELLLFGLFYMNWLQYIHSNNLYDFKKNKLLVSPHFHKLHHQYHCKNFGHVFIIWDKLGGTFIDK